MATKLQIRRDTASNWTSANPTLSAGELGFETDTLKLKIGTGSTAWSSLSYFVGDVTGYLGGGNVQHIIPAGNELYDLGDSDSRFRDLYLSGSTIKLGSVTLSVDSGTNALVLPAGTQLGNVAVLDSAGVQNVINQTYIRANQIQYNTSDFADSSFVTTQVNALVDAAPGALNTLNELAAALGDDANFSTTVTNSIATKLPLAGGTMTGALTTTEVNIGAGATNGSKLRVHGKIVAGDISSTTGDVLLEGYYGNGATSVIGSERSSGGLFLGYGVHPSTTTQGQLISSTPAALTQAAYVLSDQHKWYTTVTGAAVAVGSQVTGAVEAMRLTNNGNVGIDETAPLAKLHVVGGRANGTVYNTIIAAGGVNSTDGSGARLILTGCENDPLARGTVIEGISTGTGNSHQLNFKTNNGSNTPTTRMTIGHTGNVGIGTMSPTMGLLEVSGSKYVNTNSGKALGGIHVSPDSAATLGQFGGAISFSAGGNGSSAIAAVNDGGSDNDSTGLAFFVHGSGTGSDDANEVVRIDQLGNVGIGDMSPFAKLHVEDTGWSSGSPYGTIAYIQGGATNDANWGHLLISQSGTTTDTGGRLAFGANGENPIAGIRAKYKGATYGDLAFSTRPSGGTNTERMVISSTGNVTKPNQASFNAKSPAVTSGDNTIIFGSERHDTGSNYDASTGIFTAPVAGVYQFHVYVLMNPGNNEYGRVLFRVNNVGSNMESYGDNLTYVAGQPSYFGLGMSANIYMAFQDNIRVYNAGQWATYGTAYGSFSGMLIGQEEKMADYTITLTDTEVKSLKTVMVDIDEWVTNATINRARIAKKDIIAKLVEHCNANDITIATGEDAQVTQAYTLNIVEEVTSDNSTPE